MAFSSVSMTRVLIIGTTFNFCLDCFTYHRSSFLYYAMTTPTLWVIDDDEDDQLFIRSAFEQNDPPISVLVLDDGDELLPKLSGCAQLPKLILLDVNMPRSNGFETLEKLREVPRFADLPVVMLTTSSSRYDCERSMALGANHFLTKPHCYEQLKQMVKELSQKWQLV